MSIIKDSPEYRARKIIDACADCDCCRYLMDTSCLMFPELYRLYDRETETGEAVTATELRHLVDLCNFCALYPCPNIRADLIGAGQDRHRLPELPAAVQSNAVVPHRAPG